MKIVERTKRKIRSREFKISLNILEYSISYTVCVCVCYSFFKYEKANNIRRKLINMNVLCNMCNKIYTETSDLFYL